MKVGVLLSGCGVLDGSEIYESVITILAIERAGAEVVAIAPDVDQHVVMNHYSGAEERTGAAGGPHRSVLAESARIVRGRINSVSETKARDLDALVIPGGSGVVQNLCSYAHGDNHITVNDEVKRLITELHALGKPIGAICIAPVLVALCLSGKRPSLTAGNDAKVTMDLQRFGAHAVETSVTDIHVDTHNKIVSTSAFLCAEKAIEVEAGITKLVDRVIALARTL